MVMRDSPSGEGGGFGGVFLGVGLEGYFSWGKGGLRPVEGGDVELVDRLAARGGEGVEEAAVEAGFEAEGMDRDWSNT